MRNILILLCVCIAIITWVSDFLLPENQSHQKKAPASVKLNVSRVAQTQFDIEQLANTLGVDYSEIGKDSNEGDDKGPDIIDATLSLVSVYTSGNVANARIKIKTPDGEELINLSKGDKFESLELQEILAAAVELSNNGQQVLLKMYKPEVISITKTNGVEEVTK
ncbi:MULTISPECIES: hypothetical protein [Pseudoalteromonas]|uniref:hypothetical protein n=1 Tax=Pseudoalteromonas TaxID=53246 RepID=UPI000BB4B483|nr:MULTISPECIES: hypothetical protein [Pseudoalteromonas]HAG40758.1 hypothetical protein [Pseudoalteromonas sp.]|tara:strand:+ start:16269 stop:16763 length:495 start_codon:yes stop_codon:yes gene_type:complete